MDFLNRQMERSEVLIVEAKQYETDGIRVVAPTLFGYTEEARRIKRSVTVVSGEHRKWDEGQFFAHAQENLSAEQVQAIRELYDLRRSEKYEIRWGTGRHVGTINLVVPGIFHKSVFSVWSDGKLTLNFGWFVGNDVLDKFRDDLAAALATELAVTFPDDLKAKYPKLQPEVWVSKVTGVIRVLKEITHRHR